MSRYTKTAVLLHWLVAGLLIAEFAHGWWMQTIPKVPVGVRADAFNMHKSVGLALLALILLRLGWRIAHRPPALLPMPRWQRIAARANHALLYATMIALPLAGYFGSVFSGYPIKWFGLTLPAWGSADPALKSAMSTVHLAASWILLAATCVHVAGTVKHALAGDRVMARMAFARATASQAMPDASRRSPHGVAIESAPGVSEDGRDAPAPAIRPSMRA